MNPLMNMCLVALCIISLFAMIKREYFISLFVKLSKRVNKLINYKIFEDNIERVEMNWKKEYVNCYWICLIFLSGSYLIFPHSAIFRWTLLVVYILAILFAISSSLSECKSVKVLFLLSLFWLLLLFYVSYSCYCALSQLTDDFFELTILSHIMMIIGIMVIDTKVISLIFNKDKPYHKSFVAAMIVASATYVILISFIEITCLVHIESLKIVAEKNIISGFVQVVILGGLFCYVGMSKQNDAESSKSDNHIM